ncbi:HpcH/HpaI aldolase/citrate lyase domain, partial [Trinorchestia longiramus]
MLGPVCRLLWRRLSRQSCYRTYSAQVRHVPRRALLYVPGSDERKIAKIPQVAADCVALDCEDGVALNMKDAARRTILKTLDEGCVSIDGKDVGVRVNSVSSGLWRDDLEIVLAAKRLPTTLHLPKVDSLEDINLFAAEVERLLQGRLLEDPLRVIFFCESGLSLLRLPELCERGLSLPPQLLLDGFVFGSDDFCADIGMTRTSMARELLYARQKFVSVVRAFRLQAIDLVYIDYKNLAGLERQSLEGASFGFTGKQVIHPCQVDIVQRAFSPSPDRLQWATELLEAYERHQKEGARHPNVLSCFTPLSYLASLLHPPVLPCFTVASPALPCFTAAPFCPTLLHPSVLPCFTLLSYLASLFCPT